MSLGTWTETLVDSWERVVEVADAGQDVYEASGANTSKCTKWNSHIFT